jgi:hypothetical protein
LNWAQLRFSAQPRPTSFFLPQPATLPLPTGPQPLGQPSPPSPPSRPRVSGALPDCRLPHGETPHPAPAFAPLRARLTGGSHLSSPPSGSARPRPCRHRIPPPPATTQHLEMPLPCRYSPPPSMPPLTPHYPAFNGVKAITAGCFPLPRPIVPHPGHYKRAPPLTVVPHTFPLAFLSSQALAPASSYPALPLPPRR